MRSMPSINAQIKIAENMPDIVISPGRPNLADKMANTFFNPSTMMLTKDNFHSGSKDLDSLQNFPYEMRGEQSKRNSMLTVQSAIDS